MTDRYKYPNLRAVDTDPNASLVDTFFWVARGNALKGYTPKELLNAFEAGEVDGDTAVRIKKNAPNTRLRRIVRELVWLAYLAEDEAVPDTAPLALFETAFQQAPIGMVLSDLAGRIE